MKETEVKAFFEELMSSPEKMGDFGDTIEKSLGFFQEIVETLKNATDEEREKITKSLEGIENDLNSEFEKLCENSGVSRSELEKMISDPENFDSKEWSVLQDFKKKLDEKSPTTEKKPVKKTKKFKKTKKSWITA